MLANPGNAVNRLVRGWVHTLASPLRAIDKVRDVTVMILNQKIEYCAPLGSNEAAATAQEGNIMANCERISVRSFFTGDMEKVNIQFTL